MSAHFPLPTHSSPTTDKALIGHFRVAAGDLQEMRRDDLQPVGALLHFGHDSEIYGEGDSAMTFFKVVSGVVRTCKFLSDGRRQIDAFHVAGDIFGFELGFEHGLSAEAVSDCTLVPYRRANEIGAEAMSPLLFSHAMKSFARAQEHSLLLGRKSAVEKVAAFLIDWAEQTPAGAIVNLAMTRQDIADYLGLTIETVSRTFSQLERDGLIELPAARQIRLKDKAALRALNA